MGLQICQVVNSPVSSNCYIVYDNAINGRCIILDPGSVSNKLLKLKLDELDLIPDYIILTHEHFDHCWGVNALRGTYPQMQLICSALCSAAIQNRKKNMSLFYDQVGFEIEQAEIVFDEPADWLWNDYKFRFYPMGGHTDASVCVVCGSNVFTGDTLIKDMKTVTKLPTGSIEKLKNSLSVIERWKGHGCVVYPGHGDNFQLDVYDLRRAL